jgi:hypothetical protein
VPADERLHLRAEYQRYDWRARATWNDANFYDLFGPTRTGRKGYTVGLGYHRTLVYDEPRRLDLETDVMYAGRLDRLPQYQNVACGRRPPVRLRRDAEGRFVRSSLGRVDDEKGRAWSVSLDGNRVAGDWFARAHGTFDVGAPLPLRHSSIWLRSAAGFSPGSRDEPFANFFFGGFGNNWIDRGNEKRYRAYYAFPGADLNEIGGRNFVRSTLEWNLPPLKFRRAGTPGVLLHVDAAGPVRRHARDQPRTRRLAAGRHERGGAARLPVDDALDARHDAVGRRRRGVRGRIRAPAGADGVVQDPQVAAR